MELNEILETIDGIKEQSSLAIEILVSKNVNRENIQIKLSKAQAKIDPKHMRIFKEYISYSKDDSYVDINKKLFEKWFIYYKEYEYKYKEDFQNSNITKEVHKDLSKFKKEGYTPFGIYYSEYLEIELEMTKQDYPSDAENIACRYDSIYMGENGILSYLISCEVLEKDKDIKNIIYRILPEEKRNLNIVKDKDFIDLSKADFLKELFKNINRRFDCLSYRITE